MDTPASQRSLHATYPMRASQDSAHQDPKQEDPSSKQSCFQAVYHAFGFSKGYNFTLCKLDPRRIGLASDTNTLRLPHANSLDFICVGALFGFGASRLQDYDFHGHLPYNVTIGLWYYLSKPGLSQYGMFLHVAAAVPAALLQAFQFTPIVRRSFPTFHRINGYIVLVLLLVSNVGCAIIIRRPVGFDISMQTSGALLIILTTFAAGMALWNIKRLQIDQHRAWMIRCVAYLGTSVSFRCIVLPATVAITSLGTFYAIWPCDQIEFTMRQYGTPDTFTTRYPQCAAINNTMPWDILVRAAWDDTAPESKGAATSILFGPVLWLCLFLHIVLVEVYLALTPREAARLRQISYERQLAAGFKDAGNAGSSIERWGDAEKWKPTASP